MQIVIDKSYLQGVATEAIQRLCEEHTVLLTETLFYEILTATESVQRACFAKLSVRENPVVLIPCVGPLLHYEIEHRQAAFPLIDYRLPFTVEFNPQLSTGTFRHPLTEEETLAQWRKEVQHEVETFHLGATEVAAWCPELRELSSDARRTACEDLKQQTGVDVDAVSIDRQTHMKGGPP